MDDPQNRESIYHYLTDMPRVFPVGRLDKDSEGLLILTDDGDFANILMHPRYKLEKTYKVHIIGSPTEKDIEKLETGVYLEGRKTQPCSIKRIRQLHGEAEYIMKIKEGRKRQIRNMFLIIGCTVKKLVRISMGNLKLGDLQPGTFRIIGEKEINEMRKSLEKPIRDIADKKKQSPSRKKGK
jgi:pseudouridine synthase